MTTSIESPKLYLVTPFLFGPAPFAEELARALDAGPVACVRLQLRGVSESELKFAIDQLRPVCHSREVALVLLEYDRVVKEMDLDGVHFDPGQNRQTEARSLLGSDKIVGVGCGASRHLGMTAAERGADYVSFGPVSVDPALKSGNLAESDLFAWWQAMIEAPVVAEGGMTPQIASQLVGSADFIAANRSVWRHPEGSAAGVKAYHAAFKHGPGEAAA
ncbi:MAG: thiamine phosphate synthase [Neomegalonema sp.]